MKNYHIIIIVLLGFFFFFCTAYACGKGTKDHTCKMEVTANGTKKMSCCEGEKSSNKKGCGGKCGDSKCGCSSACPSVSFSITPVNFSKNNVFDFSSTMRIKFSYVTPSISDGFSSIWLIPKIG